MIETRPGTCTLALLVHHTSKPLIVVPGAALIVHAAPTPVSGWVGPAPAADCRLPGVLPVTLAPHVVVDAACVPFVLGVQSPTDSGWPSGSAHDHTAYVAACAVAGTMAAGLAAAIVEVRRSSSTMRRMTGTSGGMLNTVRTRCTPPAAAAAVAWAPAAARRPVGAVRPRAAAEQLRRARVPRQRRAAPPGRGAAARRRAARPSASAPPVARRGRAALERRVRAERDHPPRRRASRRRSTAGAPGLPARPAATG